MDYNVACSDGSDTSRYASVWHTEHRVSRSRVPRGWLHRLFGRPPMTVRCPAIVWLVLCVSCAGESPTQELRKCPALPSQMEPDEVTLIHVTTIDDPSALNTITASVSAGGGFMDAYASQFSDSFSAEVNRIAARIICRHPLVLRAEERATVQVE